MVTTALLLGAALLAVFGYFGFPAFAASLGLTGKAKGANTGAYLDFTGTYNANARVSWQTGNFSGYAWSEDLGWVAFGTVNNPSGPVTVNTTTGAVSGKAYVLNTGAYIDFNAAPYASNVVINPATGVFSGYAWSEDVGWLDFNDTGVSVVDFTADVTEPATNASNIQMQSASSGGYAISEGSWTKSQVGDYTWTAGADNPGGSGLKGYCLYLGTDPNADPGNSVTETGTSGLLDTNESPVSPVGTACLFIVAPEELDLGAGSFLTSALVNNTTYYLRIKAIDNGGNTYNTSAASFSFRFDDVPPTNVSYTFCPGSSFDNIADMFFSWPTTGGAAATDAHSGVLGWQYQLNSTVGTWMGTATGFGINYIPTGAFTYNLTQEQDGGGVVIGENTVYFRTVDVATNPSSGGTVASCVLNYGGQAPSFGGSDVVTVSPPTSESNIFALSWPEATPAVGRTITNYYYMVNISAPSNLDTLQNNPTTYIDNGTSTTVSSGALPGVNKGSNIVRVVAVDNESGYSPSNVISGSFTLNSTDPDNVGNLTASDASIKATSTWLLVLSWTEPVYQGAGNLAYYAYRSSNGVDFALVGATTGLSFVDVAPSSSLFYYKIVTRDGASAESSGTNAVSITPTGRFTSPANLVSGPTATDITSRHALITWTTDRTSDSKVQYGTSSGTYLEVEPSIAAQVAAHSITLPGLSFSTTYYYRARWTDEDGNTGVSPEKTFMTQPPPAVTDVVVSNVGLDSALISFTVERAAAAKVLYGPTAGFGGLKEINTSLVKSRYSVQLSSLADGTKYFFRVDPVDADGESYSGTVLSFSTYPRPRISSVSFQEVPSATTTIEVTWESNAPLTSVATYYPEGNPGASRDVVSLARVTEHKLTLSGLLPNTTYIITVHGTDVIGNEAVSDSYKFTTATDSRAPEISNVLIETSLKGLGAEATAQVVVSWETDEPATGQLEWDSGAGDSYSRRTPVDTSLIFYHTQVLSDLDPSQVYHFRIATGDEAGNEAKGTDFVFITPERTDSAWELIIAKLGGIFSFLSGLSELLGR